MKKLFQVIGVSLLLLILFRGSVYRALIKYKAIGTRTTIKVIDKNLIEAIEFKSANRVIDIEEIVAIAGKITNESLNFGMSRTSKNPNKLITSNQANCVGYSAMFNSIANYLIEKNKLEHKIKAEHKIGELSLLGINLHECFQHPFFSNHDFNEIMDKETGRTIRIDPSVSDYLRIKRIAKK